MLFATCFMSNSCTSPPYVFSGLTYTFFPPAISEKHSNLLFYVSTKNSNVTCEVKPTLMFDFRKDCQIRFF